MQTDPNMGLTIWDQLTDLFDHTQLSTNWTKVGVHDHTSSKGVQIPTGGLADGSVTTAKLATGAVGPTQLSNAAAQSAGVNESGQVVKGAVNIAASETRTSTSYGTLTTPDQVSVVLPTNGLISVLYQATWHASVGGQVGRAAIFVGSNQLQMALGQATSTVAAVSEGSSGTVSQPIASAGPFGIASPDPGGSTTYAGDVTTGQSIGVAFSDSLSPAGLYLEYNGSSPRDIGDHLVSVPWGQPTYIFAAAGTYTVSIQFKASSGSVTASNRKLWVQALSFA